MLNSSLVLLNGTNELAASAINLVQTTSNEGDLLCRAIYESVEVPDVSVDIEALKDSVDVTEKENGDE
jgi:hypothetical protein